MNSDEVIISSLIRYGEADGIARVLTREHGRLSLFARNAFKPSKKRGSVLQAPARGRVSFRLKEEGLSTLTELDLGSYTHALASNLRGFALAAYACELIEVFLAEHDPMRAVFDLLDAFLEQAAYGQISTQDLRDFEFRLLENCGLLSELDAQERDLGRMARIFAWHLRQHKQTPLKSLAFFKQLAPGQQALPPLPDEPVLGQESHQSAPQHRQGYEGI